MDSHFQLTILVYALSSDPFICGKSTSREAKLSFRSRIRQFNSIMKLTNLVVRGRSIKGGQRLNVVEQNPVKLDVMASDLLATQKPVYASLRYLVLRIESDFFAIQSGNTSRLRHSFGPNYRELRKHYNILRRTSGAYPYGGTRF